MRERSVWLPEQDCHAAINANFEQKANFMPHF